VLYSKKLAGDLSLPVFSLWSALLSLGMQGLKVSARGSGYPPPLSANGVAPEQSWPILRVCASRFAHTAAHDGQGCLLTRIDRDDIGQRTWCISTQGGMNGTTTVSPPVRLEVASPYLLVLGILYGHNRAPVGDERLYSALRLVLALAKRTPGDQVTCCG
jgi:hypothetical protein